MNSEPLVEAELDQLGDLLARFGSQAGMNPEELDGFFAALICGPSNVLPSEYLPELLRDGIVDAMSTQSALQELISLVTRHWNTICNTLQSGDVFTPLLLEDMRRTLERLAPREIEYGHNDFSIRTANMQPDETENGHSHCKAMFLRASETLNVTGGVVQLGTGTNEVYGVDAGFNLQTNLTVNGFLETGGKGWRGNRRP
jgi:thiamine phosphate synthase YjbQ (UPF0047 family)